MLKGDRKVMSEKEPTIQELFDLSGKVAMVTGAAGYLGSAISRGLAEAGASVIVSDIEAEIIQAATKKLPSPQGVAHHGVVIDHFSEDSIKAGVEEALKAAGKIDILVNNGYGYTGGCWADTTASQFNKELANATGYFLLAREIHNNAVERKGSASIIMLGSMYGLVASYPDVYEDLSIPSVAYQVMKAGVIQMTRHLAVYWAKDEVRVNSISPGPFPPSQASSTLLARLSKKVPMNRIGKSYEMKGAVLFLASDASSYVTGHNLNVNGGWTAW